MGMYLDGHVTIPYLGYKKDTFLEPSLVSNIHFSHLTKQPFHSYHSNVFFHILPQVFS